MGSKEDPEEHETSEGGEYCNCDGEPNLHDVAGHVPCFSSSEICSLRAEVSMRAMRPF